MDQGSNQTLAADATTDLSVSSVASSLANLELNPSPISRLPDMLFRRILYNVKQTMPIQKFARLRAVDTRWRSMVGKICKNQKSLTLVMLTEFSETLQLEEFFFGLLRNNRTNERRRVNIRINVYEDYEEWDPDFACGYCVDTVGYKIFESLRKALPNIERLFIYCPRTNGLDGQIASYVNSLPSLKQLHVYGAFESLLDGLKKTLPRLQSFFFNTNRYTSNKIGYTNALVDYVRFGALKFDIVRQLHASKSLWLANVAELYFQSGLNDQFDQIVPFLREHAIRLKVLNIKFSDTTLITPALFGHLANLTQLSEIALGPVTFEVLKQVATPLATISTCYLVIADFDVRSVTVDQFTRVLVTIFPGVHEWNFAFVPNALASFLTQLKEKLTDDYIHHFWYYRHLNVPRCEIFENNLDDFFEFLMTAMYG